MRNVELRGTSIISMASYILVGVMVVIVIAAAVFSWWLENGGDE